MAKTKMLFQHISNQGPDCQWRLNTMASVWESINTENEVLIEENYIYSQEFVNRTRTIFQTTDFFKTRVKKVLYH